MGCERDTNKGSMVKKALTWVVRGVQLSTSLHADFNFDRRHPYGRVICTSAHVKLSPCAILLCGCDNTVVDRHGSLDRLADWYHHLLLVLLLHHLLIFIPHWYLRGKVRRNT